MSHFLNAHIHLKHTLCNVTLLHSLFQPQCWFGELEEQDFQYGKGNPWIHVAWTLISMIENGCKLNVH